MSSIKDTKYTMNPICKFAYRILWFYTFAILCFCTKSAQGQNLIPNPGFEDLFTQFEFQWVQPQGPFYHYEQPHPKSPHQAHGGDFNNGICMYSNEPNEYLHVKLLEPLKAKMVYRVTVKARVLESKMDGVYSQKYIGVFFGNKAMNTHIPGDLFMDPQVNLVLPITDRVEWFEMTGSFEAKGGEQYLTMGYFFNTRTKEARESYIARESAANHRKYAESNVSDEDKAWLYLSPDEQKAYLKANKKALKKQKKEAKKTPYVMNASDSLRQLEARKYQGPVDQSYFRVRYYFDDMCLVEELPDSSESCEPAELAEKIETGSTIQLRNVFFKSGEAILYGESDFQLNALLRIMESNPGMRIEVRGYTDDVGKDSDNLVLSDDRAAAVVRWLENAEISRERLSFNGFGATDFVDTNDTEAGRANNRRVTFYIISM